MKILVVEDDELIIQSLVKSLTDQHYTVDVATDGKLGWEFIEAFAYDLIVLDVMLPKVDGITLCRQMRSRGIKTLVLLLTAANSDNNKVIGLDAGADDYMTKPFNITELSARIRALLRRGNSTLLPLLKWEDLQLDPSICQVSYKGKTIHLTPKEYGLLELFLRNPHKIFSRSAIIDHLWSFEEPPGDDTVRAHIKGLRMKLKAAALKSDPIETVYGIGYRLKAIEEVPEKQEEVSHLEQKTQQITASVWERAKERLSQRIEVIEKVTLALAQNQVDAALITKAHQNAHKLAGSLGMFGFENGSHLALEIEHLFEAGLSLLQQQKSRLSDLVRALRQELQLSTTNLASNLVSNNQTILIIAQEELLSHNLTQAAVAKGFKSQIARNITEVKKQICEVPPHVLVVEVTDSDPTELFREIHNIFGTNIPILVLAANNFIDRIKVARLGGSFLPKPVEASEVIEVVTNMIRRSQETNAKILLVDDDPEILLIASHLLQAWGMKVTLLENPLMFWDILEKTTPDLLVLDVEMSEINGIELCKVVRHDSRYHKLPVVFLTSHNDAQTRQLVFASGADDYVIKSNLGSELVTRILNRLERVKLM